MSARDESLPFGVIDPDYARIFTIARCMAWQEGYACCLNGSFTRDLDLLLVPWADHASDAHHLVKRIACAAELKLMPDCTEKPHGRKAYTMLFPGFTDPRFVDVSIFPAEAKT